MKRPLSSKNGHFIGVATCHRVLGGDRSGIVLWGERRKGGVDFVIGHRHRRSGCAKGEHDSKSDRGLVDIVVAPRSR